MSRKVLLGFDARGEVKLEEVERFLRSKKFDVKIADCKGLDYVDSTKLCAKLFETNHNIDNLILLCGTGVGVSMVANRFSFLRAVDATEKEFAYFARRHENANCLCLPAGYADEKCKIDIESSKLLEIIDVFLKTPFEGGRHEARVAKLSQLGE